MLRTFLPVATLFSVLFIALPASAELILSQWCRQGYCGETKYLGKTLVQQGQNGALYAVELARRSYPMDSTPPATFEPSETSYIYCSTSRPAYIFVADDTIYAHLLNPGGDWYGYNAGDYPIYWATCHNFVGPDFFSPEMTNRAIRLGYPLNLESDQIELNNVLDIMN